MEGENTREDGGEIDAEMRGGRRKEKNEGREKVSGPDVMTHRHVNQL